MLDDTPTRLLVATMLLVIFVGLGMAYLVLVGDLAIAEAEMKQLFDRTVGDLEFTEDIEQFDCEDIPPLQRYRRRAPTVATLLDDCPVFVDGPRRQANSR